MTVFGHSGGGLLTGKQVFPVDCESDVSKRLVEAAHCGDLDSALECIADPFVDVNFVSDVCLKSRKTEVVLHEESSDQVRFEYEELKTEVSALFLAAHGGNLALVRKLLSVGVDVNQKLFRGFATTATVRENHLEIMEILIKAGASQLACEEALLEASYYGRPKHAEVLMGSEMIRPHIAVHALVIASSRGFISVVDTLIKFGVSVNSMDRVLLRSSKPPLHANVNCNALVAATVSKQVFVVRRLLQAGVRTDTKVRLGAWSWDTTSGEELRVGVGLAEPYNVSWCAVEYFESSGSILRLLLQRHPPNALHLGRSLLHHSIMCGNERALDVLLECGADIEQPVKTTRNAESRPIHLAARFGQAGVLRRLINAGCDINSRTECGETALMLCSRYKQGECLRILASSGADFALISWTGQCAASIADANKWASSFQQVVLEVISSGKAVHSSNVVMFSPLIFAARSGDSKALNFLLQRQDINLNEQDVNGISPVMAAAIGGHVESFRLLLFAGADVKLYNKYGGNAMTLSEEHPNRDLFEKAMLEFAIEKGNYNGGFYALHCAARRGDLTAVRLLTSRGENVNITDSEGSTPLMLAAREGHGSMCELLISSGARCDVKNVRGETALELARKHLKKEAEHTILDELARALVSSGRHLQKHTKHGKGAPHEKLVRMVADTGVLRWGNSSKRNVVCMDAEVGPSIVFRRNRQSKDDANAPGTFRVATTKRREVHFVCEGGFEMAELWVRGIKLITRQALAKGEREKKLTP